MKKILLAVVGVLVIIAVSAFLGYRRGKRDADLRIVTQHDTTFVVDTIVDIHPVSIARRVIDSIIVPCYIPEYIHDTVFVYIPKEQKVYEGDDYYAVISGYKPNLDTIKVFPTTAYIESYNTIVKPRKWTIGVTAGPSLGIDFNGQPYAGVSLTLGLQRAFIINK